jgi:hypothetical protein
MSVDSIDKKVVGLLLVLLNERLGETGEEDYIWALKLALSAFNAHPPCTYYSLADEEFCNYFSELLVSYAVYAVLGAAALRANDEPDAILYRQQAEFVYNSWERRILDVKHGDRFYKDWVKDEEDESDILG